MVDTSELMKRLLKLYQEDPERFTSFESKVWVMLLNMPEESYLKLSERCKPDTLPILRDVVMLFMLDQPWDPGGSYWEFVDEGDTIRRSSTCYQSVPRPIKRWLD